MTKTPTPLPASIDGTLDLLSKADYLADRSLATVLFLALKMGRPLFLEGELEIAVAKHRQTEGIALGLRDARRIKPYPPQIGRGQVDDAVASA